jgi:hypothetical protein
MFHGHGLPAAKAAFHASWAQQVRHVHTCVKSIMAMVADTVLTGELIWRRECVGGRLQCVKPWRVWKVTVAIPGVHLTSVGNDHVTAELVAMYRRLGYSVACMDSNTFVLGCEGLFAADGAPCLPRARPVLPPLTLQSLP